MIFDKLERAERYYYLNKNFQKAFNYINDNSLIDFESGKYDIDGDNSFLIIAAEEPNPDFMNKLEAHRKYIDIQMSLKGSFNLAWKALEDCKSIITDYDSEKDAIFYSDLGDFEVTINPGTFAILFAEDAHFPQTPKTYIKKAILKIKL